MKSLIKKEEKKKKEKKADKKPVAQCCAKTATPVAGCHD
jgi:hypothetical protein